MDHFKNEIIYPDSTNTYTSVCSEGTLVVKFGHTFSEEGNDMIEIEVNTHKPYNMRGKSSRVTFSRVTLDRIIGAYLELLHSKPSIEKDYFGKEVKVYNKEIVLNLD